MRLWHKDLIPVLPRLQLLGQWRECCLIAKNIAEKGTPNHVLVNRVMEYSEIEYIRYCELIYSEMLKRGYKVDLQKFYSCFEDSKKAELQFIGSICWSDWNSRFPLFPNWHNDRYLKQCLFNLQEKADACAIPDDEWKRIVERYPWIE